MLLLGSGANSILVSPRSYKLIQYFISLDEPNIKQIRKLGGTTCSSKD